MQGFLSRVEAIFVEFLRERCASRFIFHYRPAPASAFRLDAPAERAEPLPLQLQDFISLITQCRT